MATESDVNKMASESMGGKTLKSPEELQNDLKAAEDKLTKADSFSFIFFGISFLALGISQGFSALVPWMLAFAAISPGMSLLFAILCKRDTRYNKLHVLWSKFYTIVCSFFLGYMSFIASEFLGAKEWSPLIGGITCAALMAYFMTRWSRISSDIRRISETYHDVG